MNKFELSGPLTIYFSDFSQGLYNRIMKEYLSVPMVYRGVFEKYLVVKQSGLIIAKGYRWDGCTPKYKLFGRGWIGTPDGSRDENGKQRMFVPSCVHDILYVNMELIPFSRKTVDLMFYELAKQNDFKFAWLYYAAVRAFGGIYHNTMRFIKRCGKQ
jgi:hypothetical protein